MSDAEVDVVVPVLDGGERFSRCLEAISSQRDVRARLIVVDNGSTDGSRQLAVDAGALVLDEAQRSSYAARNRGLAATTAQVVAFTDGDCIPEPTWLRAGLDAMERKGWDLCGGSVRQERAGTLVGRHDELTYLQQQNHVETFGFGATANLFVRREVFVELGPFDGDLRSGGDLEFGRRATAAGRSLGFAPDAVVWHAPRESLVAVVSKAWRIGVGHGEVGRRYPSVLRWGLSPKRLVPERETLRRHWRRPVVLAVDVVVAWVSWAARLITVLRSARHERRTA